MVSGPRIRSDVDVAWSIHEGRATLVSKGDYSDIMAKVVELQKALQGLGAATASVQDIPHFVQLKNQAMAALKPVRKSIEAMFESKGASIAESEGDSEFPDEIGKFWVVVRPEQESELDDVVFEADAVEMVKQGRGGMNFEMIAGVFKNEAKAKKTAEDLLQQRDDEMGDVLVQHGFNQLHISASDWNKVISAVKVSYKPVRSEDGWKWMGKDIALITGNDPITGKYYAQGKRDDEQDYASAVGIEGKTDLVDQVVALIKKYGKFTGESEGSREWI